MSKAASGNRCGLFVALNSQNMNDQTLLVAPNSGESIMPEAGSSLPSSAERSPGKSGRANLSNLSLEQRKKWRASQNRQSQARARARRAALGDRTITIILTAGELAKLNDLRNRQRGPIEGFERRALLVGATFLANAGNPRGKKAKGNVAASVICPAIADTSAIKVS